MNTPVRGQFITLDGIEGGGKTTQLHALKDYLAAQSIDTIVTREPGGTPIAEAIRALLLNPGEDQLAVNTELLLMFAARAQHIAQIIEPALQSGQWVLSDRFTDATYAYQGGGRQVPPERIAILETWLLGEQRPDLTLIFDVAPATGLARAADRRGSDAADRFEQQQLAFFERAAKIYRDRAERSPHRYAVIDANQTEAEVSAAVRNAVQRLLTNRR